MNVLETMDRLERDFLRAVYELADRKAKRAVSFAEVRIETGHSEDEADRACGFWDERGILEWTGHYGHIALTQLGLRRAERMAQSGWSPSARF